MYAFPTLSMVMTFCALSSVVYPPHVYVMEPLNETMLDDVALETCYISLSASWYPAVQASAGRMYYLHGVYSNQGLKWDIKDEGTVIAHPIAKWHDACVANVEVLRGP